jgi:hypothetical protein
VRALESGRELAIKRERCGGGRGWCSPFIGEGALGRGGNSRLIGFNAIDGGEGLRGGLIGEFKVGAGDKCLTGITRRETGTVGMARCGE